MGSLTALDIIVLFLVGGGIVLGFMKGFVGEVLSLMAWVAGVVALKIFHEPASAMLLQPVGTPAGAAVLAFILVFGFTFLVVKLIARRIGNATKKSVVGPVDRVLGGGFGALKGLIASTLLFLAANLFYDTVYGRFAERPDWMRDSRTFPLLHASGNAVVEFVERQRGTQPPQAPAPQ